MRKRLASVYSGPVTENAPLAPLTRFGLGGTADWLFEPRREEEVGPLLALLHEERLPVTLLGDGCNVLIRDGGIRGAVLRIARGLSQLRWEGDLARCGAGLASALLARRSVEEHRGGLEWAASLPGKLGGALRMNAGAYGGCLADVFHACRGWTFAGERAELGREDVKFDYRYSSIPQGLVITEITLALPLLPEEAWEDSDSPPSKTTGNTLRGDYKTLEDLRKAVPKLIIEHNLHGIDIDPRAVQIAALALWLRAQKTWKNLGLKPKERPRITKSNIVTAEPMPGEEDLRQEFLASLDSESAQLVKLVFDKMELAGEAGSLLRIEEDIREAIREVYAGWGGMYAAQDEERWQKAEERILSSLREYAERVENGGGLRRRLFAEDAARGFAFVDLCRKRFDVVLMNPPFGDPSKPSKPYIEKAYPRTKNDVYAAMVERGLELLEPRGMLGAITSRTGFFLTSFRKWREEILLKEARPTVFADLGNGVMDAAMVEAAAYCLEAVK